MADEKELCTSAESCCPVGAVAQAWFRILGTYPHCAAKLTQPLVHCLCSYPYNGSHIR